MANALVSLVEREAPFLAFTADKKKVVCTLNNHELPARMEAVEAFANGKKYRRLKARKATEDWADKYRPFLVPSVNFPNMMFCALTNHVIQKRRAVVEEHLKGRKFKMAQERFQKDETALFEEPTIAEMEEAIAAETEEAIAAETEEAIAADEQAAADGIELDGDASDDGSFEFEFEPMGELTGEANASLTTKTTTATRKRAAGRQAARRSAKK